MSELKSNLESMNLNTERNTFDVNQEVKDTLLVNGYTVSLYDYSRPWGGFNQLDNRDANRFVEEFFPDLSPEEARLGHADLELSPKILVVAPEQRLSWQYHNRRAERWLYLTDGAYYRSPTDEQGEIHYAKTGEVVQFEKSERHRLIGAVGHYTIVAEIWQHTDKNDLSNEDDIVRLSDDYRR